MVSMHPRTWLSLLTLPLVAAFSYPVLLRGYQSPRTEQKLAKPDPLDGLADIQDVLALVRDNYVDPPDLAKVVGGGIQAALERAHPLNAYLLPEDLRLPDAGPADIGIKVVKRGIYAHVVHVRPGSPAALEGIQVGEAIRRLDGESIGPLSAWTLERRLRGPEGSTLSVTRFANRTGDVKTVKLTRTNASAASISVRKETGATVVGLPDLNAGRAQELKQMLGSLDHALPLLLDLRLCAGGDVAEAARVAGLFVKAEPFATLQEAGKPDQGLAAGTDLQTPFSKMAILTGFSTIGPAELLASALKKQGLYSFGERTAGLGVERTRFLLRQGGAVELVNRRWIGAGGEKLDRVGVAPEFPLRGLKPEEDPLPKILEILAKPREKVPAKAEKDKQASLDPLRTGHCTAA
jgi:carboxyl-terminal processing protease